MISTLLLFILILIIINRARRDCDEEHDCDEEYDEDEDFSLFVNRDQAIAPCLRLGHFFNRYDKSW
jgi:hypothetical protein